MLEAQNLLYHSNKISFVLWSTCHGRYASLIFHKTIHVIHKFCFHFLKYLLQVSFRSCKYLLVSYTQVLDVLWPDPKTFFFSSNAIKFSLLLYQLFTSKQNSRNFEAHCNIFIYNLNIQEQTCLPLKRCC